MGILEKEKRDKIVIKHISSPVGVIKRETFYTGVTIRQATKSVRGPFLVLRNDVPILRKDWDRPIEKELVIFRLPVGADIGQTNGEDGSNPWRIAATIGIMALAMSVPGGGIMALGLKASIMVGGTLLLNVLFPIKTPSVSQDLSTTDTTDTYSLSSPTNSPRIGEVIPVQYGRMMTTPPMISQPWFEFVENEQYVYVLLTLGWGYFEVEKLLFDNLLFDQFPEVEYHVMNPGESVPYHDNVFSSPHVTGQEINRKNDFELVNIDQIVFVIDDDQYKLRVKLPSSVFNFQPGDQIYFPDSVNNAEIYYTVLRTIYIPHPTLGHLGYIVTKEELTYEVLAGPTDIKQYSPYIDSGDMGDFELLQREVLFVVSGDTSQIRIKLPSSVFNFQPGDQIYFPDSVNNTGNYTILNFSVVPHPWLGYLAYVFFEESTLVSETVTTDVLSTGTAPNYTCTDFFPTYYRFPEFVSGNDIFFDIVFPNGLYEFTDSGDMNFAKVELIPAYKTINSLGVVSDEIIDFPESSIISIESTQKTPLRQTIQARLPEETGLGYLVGLKRMASSISSRTIDTCQWVGLRVNYEPKLNYPGITTIQIKAKASSGLSQDALSRIRVLSTRKLPVWDSGAVVEATQSIAAAAMDVCMNAEYSVGLPENRIDLDGLWDLSPIWQDNGDTCNGVFESKTTFWEALDLVLRTGRATRNMVGGTITFHRDQLQETPRAVFNIANIKKGSFKINPVLYTPDTPDDVEVEYFSEETWSWEKILCSLPGSDSEAPATIKKWGITNEDQAYREGIWEAACNMYRRIFVSFITELDGRLLLRTNMVSVSYPLPNWGVSGFIKDVDFFEGLIELSEPVEFISGSNGYICFRKNNGEQDGPYLCNATEDSYVIEMEEASDIPSYVTAGGRTSGNVNEYLPTFFQFGKTASSFDKKCIVLGATPLGGNTVELSLVVEDDRVHGGI